MPELLKRTDFASFNRAFVGIGEIRFYAIAAAVSAIISVSVGATFLATVAAAIVFFFYPLVEYVLHRYVLHNALLCRSSLTAGIWWRLHYRHHSEPNDEEVLLGTPLSLNATVLISALLVTAVLPGWANLFAAMAAGFLCAILFEYVHALDHSTVELRHPYLRKLRKHHLDHHFLQERGNFGLTSDLIDRLFGTAYTPRSLKSRSTTVRNLGYGEDEKRLYPWIAEIEQRKSLGQVSGQAD